MTQPGPGARVLRRARQLLPWLVAAACLAWAFAIVPVDELLAALARARLDLLLPLGAGAVVVWFLLESAAYAYAFSRFNVPLSWREARSLRALTYLLTVIHWHVAKAAVVLRLQATHGVGLLAGTSTLLLWQMIGILVLAVFAAAGAALRPELPGVREILIASVALVVGTLIAFALLRSRWPKLGLLDELRELTLLRSHRALSPADLAILCGLKAAYQLVFVLVYYFGLRAFDVALPFTQVLVATALLQVVGGLPIAPAGLGTQQAAMLLLFSDPKAAGSDGPAILAFAFALPFTTMIVRTGLACLYLGDLSRPSSAGSRESASASSSETTRV